MGVRFDRILDPFTGPFEKVNAWNLPMPPGKVVASTAVPNANGFIASGRVNNSFIALNRLLKSNKDVHRLTGPHTVNGKSYPAGSLYVTGGVSDATALNALARIAEETGVTFDATVLSLRSEDATKLRMPRIGLWDQYGGSMPAGWTRWILEQFEFPFERVFAPALDAGNLNAKYDVLVFVDGAIPGPRNRGGRGGGGAATDSIPYLPAEYRNQLGRVTSERTIPAIRDFIEKGGTVIAIGGSATNLAAFLQLPVESQLVENGQPMPRTKVYIPGSVLSIRVDPSHPLDYGMTDHTDTFFDDSPVFKLTADAASKGVKTIAWYDSKTPLRSGWAWGQQYLENGAAAIEAPLGCGKVYLFGPEILQRAQPHGTFKFLFNGIYASVAQRSATCQPGR
jgi:hypothetical protein